MKGNNTERAEAYRSFAALGVVSRSISWVGTLGRTEQITRCAARHFLSVSRPKLKQSPVKANHSTLSEHLSLRGLLGVPKENPSSLAGRVLVALIPTGATYSSQIVEVDRFV